MFCNKAAVSKQVGSQSRAENTDPTALKVAPYILGLIATGGLVAGMIGLALPNGAVASSLGRVGCISTAAISASALLLSVVFICCLSKREKTPPVSPLLVTSPKMSSPPASPSPLPPAKSPPPASSASIPIDTPAYTVSRQNDGAWLISWTDGGAAIYLKFFPRDWDEPLTNTQKPFFVDAQENLIWQPTGSEPVIVAQKNPTGAGSCILHPELIRRLQQEQQPEKYTEISLYKVLNNNEYPKADPEALVRNQINTLLEIEAEPPEFALFSFEVDYWLCHRESDGEWKLYKFPDSDLNCLINRMKQLIWVYQTEDSRAYVIGTVSPKASICMDSFKKMRTDREFDFSFNNDDIDDDDDIGDDD